MGNKVVKLMIRVIFILLVIVVCIFAAFIYSNAKQDENGLKDKIEEEIDYIDTKITSLINEINGLQLENYKVTITKVQEEESKSDTTSKKESEEANEKSTQEEEEGTSSGQETEISRMEKEQTTEGAEQTNWKLIQQETEVFYSVWASILLDLYEAGIEANKIVEFSNTLDQALISLKEKDKAKSCENFAKMYSLLPEFASKGNIEELKQNTIMAKSSIIKAYSNLEKEDWEKVLEEVQNAENKFVQIMSNVEKSENKLKYSINKSYILIEELKNSLPTKDKGIFYIKYKNLIEELNTMI